MLNYLNDEMIMPYGSFFKWYILGITCASLLTACGGGGGSASPAPTRGGPAPAPIPAPAPDPFSGLDFTERSIGNWVLANKGSQDSIDLCSSAAPTLEGTDGDDDISGTSGDDVIFGYGGNDTINGGGGNDIICAGDGIDVVYGGSGNDYLDGEKGADILHGDYGADVLLGDEGDDNLYGNSGDDILSSGPGTNKLYGGAGDDRMQGESTKDTAFGNIGSDVLAGTLVSADCDDAKAACEADPYARRDADEETPNPNASFYPSTRPKVILYLMLDDADYNDFGYQSNTAITPNFDAVAKDGMKFTDFYSASGICSPTRVSVLTGNSPISYGLSRLWPDLPKELIEDAAPDYYWSMRGLDSSERTLGKVVKSAGYDTFHIGKWHSGTSQADFLPSAHGFDDYKIMKPLPDRGVLEVQGPNGYESTAAQTWRPQYQADQIIDFIENSSGNVFVNWWPIEPHTPLIVPPTFTDEVNRACCNFDLSTQRGKLLSMMYGFDAEFGRVIDYLKSNGLYDDSLVIVTSDNGGLQTALDTGRVINGNKGNLREGGIRVPLFASWPNNIEPDTFNASVLTTYDIMPTLAGIVGAEAGDVLGEDFRPALFTPSAIYTRETPAYFQMNVHSWRSNQTDAFSSQRAMRDGCYKLTNVGEVRGELKLYNLCNDITESRNLSSIEPARFNALVTAFRKLSDSVGEVVDGVSLSGEQIELQDWRLNVHHDNLTIRAVVTDIGASSAQTIYKRGDVHLYIDGETNRVIFEAVGISNQDVPVIYRGVNLSGNIREGDEVTLSVRGYIRSASSFSLSINGAVVDSVSAPISTSPNAIGASVYALKNEIGVNGRLGDEQLSLERVSVNLAAIDG